MPSIIGIDKLTVAYGSFKALDNLSLELTEGSITGVIGPSGAGKTTLLRVLVGRQRPTSGQLTIWGSPAGSSALRRRISYMTQELSVYGDLTVTENLRYFTAMLGYHGKSAAEQCRRGLHYVSLEAHANQLVSSLSGGQKQRVSLAVSLLGEPDLLILDEPTVGLDPVLRENLWQLFHDLQKQGKTIIISSHVMDEAERCDNLLLIRGGKLIADDTPKALCERTGTSSVEQSFLKLAGDRA